ncbi:MAG TPA: GNAT family N-acetyltransferase [Acidimicrobiia bacterium]|nr:GNAT family N-acetyltransferase [Acidimicrobiia bacterium]
MPSDAPGVARVHVASWQRAYPGLINQAFLDSMDVASRTESWRRILRQTRGRVLVAEDDGVIDGFCAVGPSTEEDWGEVYAIYLDPDRWGQGVGRALLAAGERALLDDGQWQALLWVLDRNVRARAFYERQGWVPGKPIRIENIGGVDVNEARYEKALAPS